MIFWYCSASRLVYTQEKHYLRRMGHASFLGGLFLRVFLPLSSLLGFFLTVVQTRLGGTPLGLLDRCAGERTLLMKRVQMLSKNSAEVQGTCWGALS